MTDTTPAAVERLSPYAVDGGSDAYGQMEEDPYGDYVTHEAYAALSAQLEDAAATADDMEKEAHSAIAIWGAALKDRDTAHAQGKAEGLREAAGCIGHITRHEDLDAILALIPSDTPACDTKTAENVTQDALCKLNAAQEAARVLLGDDYTSPLIEVLDAYNNDYDVAQDVLKALRAIAGGRDE